MHAGEQPSWMTAIAASPTRTTRSTSSRTIHLIGSFTDEQDELRAAVRSARRPSSIAQLAEVAEQRQAADVMLAAAKDKVAADETAIAHAARPPHGHRGGDPWSSRRRRRARRARSSDRAVLTAKQLADYVAASRLRPRLTVPLDELAQLYLDEGENAGVRGDVAFAQSILETGGFATSRAAPVLDDDNNFAGIGGATSCKHGFYFPDAETGVRAQMQLLRIYVDPDLTETTFKQAILHAEMLKLGFRGKVQTWWDLWGTWATGALYGQRAVRHLRAHGRRSRKIRPAAAPTAEARRCELAVEALARVERDRAGGGCRCACCCGSTRPARRARSCRRASSSSPSTTRISSRARFAPRQWCTPWPNPRCGFGSRRDVEPERLLEHELVAVRRRLPEHDLVAGARSSWPPSSTSRVAVRRLYAAGCVQRTISSTAVAHRAGSSRSAASWSGYSVSATIAPAIALRVVSAPAAHSRLKKNCSSWSVSSGRVLAGAAWRGRRPRACRRPGARASRR